MCSNRSLIKQVVMYECVLNLGTERHIGTTIKSV